jgi:hypothetical protein
VPGTHRNQNSRYRQFSPIELEFICSEIGDVQVVTDNQKEGMEKGKPPLQDTGVGGTSETTVTDKEFPELYANGYTAKNPKYDRNKKQCGRFKGRFSVA